MKISELNSNTRNIIILAGIIFLGIILRLINLGIEPYWGDEVLSLDIVAHYHNNLPAMLNYLKTVEVHPPLYYLILNWWTQIFGWDEFGVRLLSLIFGLGVIILTYVFVKMLFNQKVALLATFFMAILPFQIEFSQEARPYIIYCFFALVATIAYWQFRRTQRERFNILYIGATLAGLFLHYSYIFFAVALASYWLINGLWLKTGPQAIRSVRIWLITHAVIFIIYFSQFINLLYKFLLANYLMFNVPRTINPTRDIFSLEKIFNQLIWLTKNQLVSKAELLGVLIFKIALISLLIWLFMTAAEELKKAAKENSHKIFFVAWLATVPVVLFIISPQGVEYAPIFERHIITSSVFIAIILAYCLSLFDLKKKLLLIVLFTISLTGSLSLIIGDDSIWDPYHRIKLTAEFINQSYHDGDIVIIPLPAGRSNLNHYLDKRISALSLYPLNLMNYNFDYMSTRETLGLMENESQLRVDYKDYKNYKKIKQKMDYFVKKYQPQRIWLVSTSNTDIEKMWFMENQWQQAMESLGPLHPVQLFRK